MSGFNSSVSDKIFLDTLPNFIKKSSISAKAKSQALDYIQRAVGRFGKLKLDQETQVINNGSRTTLSKRGTVSKRTTSIPVEGEVVKVQEIIKRFPNSFEAEKTREIEKTLSKLGMGDIVSLPTYSDGLVSSYLFEGDDLNSVFEGSDSDGRKDLVMRLLDTNLEFADRATQNKDSFDTNFIYDNNNYRQVFVDGFVKKFGKKALKFNGLENLLDLHDGALGVEVESLPRFMQHADPKFANAILTNKGEMKLIDTEFVSDSPLAKIVYYLYDRQDIVSLDSMIDNTVKNMQAKGHVVSKEDLMKEYKVVQKHEDLMNTARCFDLSRKNKRTAQNYIDVGNFYFNRALRNIEDDNFKSSLIEFVDKYSKGKIKYLSDAEFKELDRDIDSTKKQLSRYLATDFETFNDKQRAIARKVKWGKRLKRGAQALGGLALLVALAGGAFGYHKFQENQFDLETERLNVEWSRDHVDLRAQVNPCGFAFENGMATKIYNKYFEKYGDERIGVAAAYGAGELVDRLAEHNGDEDILEDIIDHLPKLLQQQLYVYSWALESPTGQFYQDRWLTYRGPGQEMPMYTWSELANIHTTFECLETEEYKKKYDERVAKRHRDWEKVSEIMDSPMYKIKNYFYKKKHGFNMHVKVR